MSDQQKRIVETADLFRTMLKKFLDAGNGMQHPPTLIATASRLAGTLMMRSVILDGGKLEVGSTILVPAAREKGYQLTAILDNTLRSLGSKFDSEIVKQFLDLSQGTNGRFGSRISLLEVQEKYEPIFSATKETLGISFEEASVSMMIATALIVQDCSQVFDLNHGYSIAVSGIVEALQTVPFNHRAA